MLGQRLRHHRPAWPDAVQRNETDLIEMVEAVKVALVEENFEQCAADGDADGLELARLEARPLVGVQREVAHFGELDFV